ncbi:uracil-DNA glycosylase [Halorhodospira halochloris]|uniref:uracil-DNA glycosylase n=1 Tax=Halorhodospira halochloris TaxID=1052 RepID=UPI00076F64E7|nr:uracil-DNA glycosylase [Halorhodospira halochloris]MBK1651563.1 uracil-DNA glycosylase [Halorhodospira halochloris]
MDRRRLSYLQRLGIDVYIPRDALIEEATEQGAMCGPARRESRESPPRAGHIAPRAVDRGEATGAGSDQTPGPIVSGTTSGTAQPEGGVSSQLAKAGTDGGSTPELGYAPPPDVAALDWLELEQTVAACRSCKLCEARTQTVFGVGDKRADLVLVGEGPGADEDRLGEPFVGRAGKLLDAMLAAIDRGRERGGVYICNIVKCRPPGNREPRPDEVAACNGYLRRQLELLEPKLIVALGRVAAQKLLASTAPLAKLRGQTHTYADTSIPVWVTYHPAYLLRSPAEKAKSWQDLKRIRAAL